jgi:2-polyprenyl-3-methyl-5-hydroxy-6-metoxy-1,4-benzoquinol methylase
MKNTKINEKSQQAYWDALAPEYRRITRISCSDFHYGPQIPGEKALKILPQFKPGDTALELGCGGAENSVWLAGRGLKCAAFDISNAQLADARKIAARRGAEIEFFQSSLADFRKKIGGRRFDFLHSSHAMEFVDNPAAVVADMAAAMKAGAWLMISTVHPLYNGEWVEDAAEAEPREPHECGCGDGGDCDCMEDEPLGEGLFLKNYFTPPDDVRDEFGEHAVSRAHPISKWFAWLKAAGLSVEDLREPAAVKNAPYSSDDWADAAAGHLSAIPSTIIFLARKNK